MSKTISEMVTGRKPAAIRAELREGTSDGLRRRRTIIALSLVGLGLAGAASLLQTGVIRHLPDPPIDNFDADKVMTSDEAYQFGIPDATLALTGLAANVPLASWGGADRASEQPLVPLIASAKAASELAVAGWYFYQMPVKLKTWCVYCIGSAGIYLAIFALTLPEAGKALATIRGVDHD